MALLVAKNISVNFPRYGGIFRHVIGYKEAVKNISLKVNSGDILGVVGQSGSGKTTLARALIRLLEPTEGEIFFENQNITHLPQKSLFSLRESMQMIFQDPYSSLNPRKSIEETFVEPLLYHKRVKTPKEAYPLVYDILNRVGLSKSVIKNYPHQFSGGQQQRICIARALLLKPKLIFCDEVVSALDVSVQAQILNLLIELQKSMNLSLVFISHDLAVVRYVCNKVLVMDQGQMCEEGSVNDVFTSPQHPYTKKLLESVLGF